MCSVFENWQLCSHSQKWGRISVRYYPFTTLISLTSSQGSSDTLHWVSLSHQCTGANRPIVRVCVVREYCLGAKELYYVMKRKSTTLTSFHFGRFPGCQTHQLGFTIRVQDCHRIHPQNPTIPPHHSLPQCRCSQNSLKFSKYGISFSYSSYSK